MVSFQKPQALKAALKLAVGVAAGLFLRRGQSPRPKQSDEPVVADSEKIGDRRSLVKGHE
jgi:hypothetical protein